MSFALQLCVLRDPGGLLAPGEFVPPPVVDFIGRQLHLDGEELGDYAVRSETRHVGVAEDAAEAVRPPPGHRRTLNGR